MKKIALIGTHGTGKTTICHELIAGLKKVGVNADYLGEIARDANAAGFRLNEGTTRESQRWILHSHITRELEFEARGGIDVLVCDRSIFDNYMYYVNQFGADALLDQIVNDHVKSYALLLKVPVNDGYLTSDGVRAMDKKFQRRIDKLIDEELRKRRIPFRNYDGIDSAMGLVLDLGRSPYHQWADSHPAI